MKFSPVLYGLLGVVSLLGGCNPPPPQQVFLDQVSLEVSPKANTDMGIAVDLVLANTSQLTGQLMGLSAAQYFATKEQLMRDNPMDLQVLSWELVPGQVLGPLSVKVLLPDPQGAVVFAHYLTPGDHRIRVGTEGKILIQLGETDVFVKPLSGPTNDF